MDWKADFSGDMTLSIVDEKGFQILRVNMLKSNTMKAGTDGDFLIRAMNDLTVIANFSRGDYDFSPEHRLYEDKPISPLPWQLEYIDSKRRLKLRNGNGRLIADRDFPASTSHDYIESCVSIIRNGLDILNKVTIYETFGCIK